jgi:hypothetical protein
MIWRPVSMQTKFYTLMQVTAMENSERNQIIHVVDGSDVA